MSSDSPSSDTGGITNPAGAGELVVRIAHEGGFVPPEVIFSNLPALLVTGDGSVYQQGPVPAIYPGPLLPNVQVSSVTEDEVQRLLALADQYGLLAERSYPRNDTIADAPDTVVTIVADGVTYTHSAYALGFEAESDPGRADLAAFVSAATGEWLSPSDASSEAFQPERFLVRATPVADLTGFDVEPTLVDWPSAVGLDLATASDCAEVSASDVTELFDGANQLTFFRQGDTTYSLAVKPAIAGDAC